MTMASLRDRLIELKSKDKKKKKRIGTGNKEYDKIMELDPLDRVKEILKGKVSDDTFDSLYNQRYSSEETKKEEIVYDKKKFSLKYLLPILFSRKARDSEFVDIKPREINENANKVARDYAEVLVLYLDDYRKRERIEQSHIEANWKAYKEWLNSPPTDGWGESPTIWDEENAKRKSILAYQLGLLIKEIRKYSLEKRILEELEAK